MRSPASTPRLRDQAGFTLPELLISMTVGLIALAAVLYFVVASQQRNEVVFERVGAVDDTSLALKRIQDPLRQAYKISPMPAIGAAPITAGILTYQGIVKTGTSYSLHSFQLDCTQADAAAGTSKCVQTDQTTGMSQVVVSDLVGTTTSTFTVRAPATDGLPRVDLVFTHRIQKGGPAVKITSSVQPRNCQTIALTAAGACPFP